MPTPLKALHPSIYKEPAGWGRRRCAQSQLQSPAAGALAWVAHWTFLRQRQLFLPRWCGTPSPGPAHTQWRARGEAANHRPPCLESGQLWRWPGSQFCLSSTRSCSALHLSGGAPKMPPQQTHGSQPISGLFSGHLPWDRCSASTVIKEMPVEAIFWFPFLGSGRKVHKGEDNQESVAKCQRHE